MGKRKYSYIDHIDDNNARNITYIKRTKGIVKKAIELSLLCDQKVFMYIYDQEKKRVIHFHSHSDLNLLDIYNMPNDREFYENKDYPEMGGESQAEKDKLNRENKLSGRNILYRKPAVNYSSKWKGILRTARIGDLNDNKKDYPKGF